MASLNACSAKCSSFLYWQAMRSATLGRVGDALQVDETGQRRQLNLGKACGDLLEIPQFLRKKLIAHYLFWGQMPAWLWKMHLSPLSTSFFHCISLRENPFLQFDLAQLPFGCRCSTGNWTLCKMGCSLRLKWQIRLYKGQQLHDCRFCHGQRYTSTMTTTGDHRFGRVPIPYGQLLWRFVRELHSPGWNIDLLGLTSTLLGQQTGLWSKSMPSGFCTSRHSQC